MCLLLILCVFRIQQVKRVTKRRQNHVDYLRTRLLEEHDEDWAVIPKEVITLEDMNIKPLPIAHQMMFKEEKQEPERKVMQGNVTKVNNLQKCI